MKISRGRRGCPPAPSLSREILRLPVHVPFRPVKDHRNPHARSCLWFYALRPLCLRCFRPYTKKPGISESSLRADYPEKSTLLRDVPKLIVENNIHGVDIDHRATQIAGLALGYVPRPGRTGLRALDRPQIVKSNVVCAEPMPGDPEQLQAFAISSTLPLLKW